jgi:hypothetical protein
MRTGITWSDLYAGNITLEQAKLAGIDSSRFRDEAPVIGNVKGKDGNELFGIKAAAPTHEDALEQIGIVKLLRDASIKE